MPRSDPERVLVAMLIGECARAVIGAGRPRAEALADIRTTLAEAKLNATQRQRALDRACAHYLHPSGSGDANWFPAAVDLLVEAGADLEAAAAIEVRRMGPAL